MFNKTQSLIIISDVFYMTKLITNPIILNIDFFNWRKTHKATKDMINKFEALNWLILIFINDQSSLPKEYRILFKNWSLLKAINSQTCSFSLNCLEQKQPMNNAPTKLSQNSTQLNAIVYGLNTINAFPDITTKNKN